jgi:thioredoxin reductase
LAQPFPAEGWSTSCTPPVAMFDCIVIGGGPAGLSAALMLGRCRRRVLVCDLGEPRNRHSHALHGYLTRDGVAPAKFNDFGRAELARYGVAFRRVAVTRVTSMRDGFRVSLADGRKERSRFVLIATGVVDHLPAIEGLSDCYGRSVFHCPYCDGWEWRDRRLAVIGTGENGAGLALSLKTWSADVLLCTDGSPLGGPERARLQANRVAVRTEPLAHVAHKRGRLTSVVFRSGPPAPRDALFFSSGQHQRSDLAAALGCNFNRRGTVNTGLLCNTNVPGVFVAGDASRDAQFVVVAAAEGTKAAIAINKAMQRQELVA